MNFKKNIIVVSARRSGTHVLMDLIVNNFGYESTNYNYIDYYKFTDEMDSFEASMNEGNKITWVHSHDYKDYYKYKHSTADQNKLDRFFSESKVILIYRDIRDIMDSCYHRPNVFSKYTTFSEFYNNYDTNVAYELIDQKYDNFFDLLIQYYKNWFSVYMSKELLGLDMEVISFEEIINEYIPSVKKIGAFLEQPTSESKIKDVRLNSIAEKREDILYTSNDFRSGKVGKWVDTINNKIGENLGNKYYVDLGAGLNCFMNDIQIHKYHTPERDKFQLKSKDWKSIEHTIDKQLTQYDTEFKSFGIDIDIDKFIEDRYINSVQRSNDFRYIHKVFYFDEYVLKFIYPCKATLDKNTFDSVIPIASKEYLLTILKTNEYLYENGITPKLYYAGIYNGVLFAIQEQYPIQEVLYEKYTFHPKWGDWKWVIELDDMYSQILTHFFKAYENNILLTDIVSVHNCAFDKLGNLKYFDLDGIKYYDTRVEMINSEDYRNVMGILKEVDSHYIEKNNYSLLEKYERICNIC